MKTYSLPLVITWCLVYSFTVNAQQDLCSRFERSVNAKAEFQSADVVRDSDLALAWAFYFEGLKWETVHNGSSTTLKLNETVKKPSSLQSNGSQHAMDLAVPPAPPEIKNKYLSSDFLKECQQCMPSITYEYRSAFTPREEFKQDAFVRDKYEKYADIALKCRGAARALLDYKRRRDGLIKEMQAYCANQNKSNTTSSSSASSSSSSSITLSSGTSSSNKKATPTSYKKAKATVQTSKVKETANKNKAASSQAYAEHIRQTARSLQGQWNAMNETDRKVTEMFDNVFWKGFREEQIREERKARNALSREKSEIANRYRNYISDWEAYERKITSWVLDYSAYLNSTILNKVERDLKMVQKNISASIEFRKKDEKRAAGFEKLDISGLGKGYWSEFIEPSERKIENTRFSSFSELQSIVYKNPSPQNKAMLADYAKIAYDHKKRYNRNSKTGHIQYARQISELFNDYPGISTMKSEVAAYDKKRAEERKRNLIRNSIKRLPQLSKSGDYIALSQMVDSLIQFGNREVFADAFSNNGTPYELHKLITEGGYYEEYLKIARWLGNKNMNNSADLNAVALYVKGDNNSSKKTNTSSNASQSNRSSLAIGSRQINTSYLSTGVSRSSYFKNQLQQANASVKAVINPTAQNISYAFGRYKATLKARGPYGNKTKNITIRWPQLALCFSTENYKWVINKDSPEVYHGIWVRNINQEYYEVVKIDKNSPADLNNIEVGDKILKVNGRTPFAYKRLLSHTGNSSLRSTNPPHNTKMNLEIKKNDGTVMSISFPIMVTKKNVKAGFKLD